MRKSGFTLVEILIAVTIFVIAMLMTAGSLVVGQRIKQKVERVRYVQEEGRSLSEFIAREIESAEPDGITVPGEKSGIITIARVDPDSAEVIKETIRPSVDGKSLEMLVTKGDKSYVQNLNSEHVRLKKLSFRIDKKTFTLPKGPQETSIIDTNLALEEETNTKTINITEGMLEGFLGQKAEIELQFSAMPKKEM